MKTLFNSIGCVDFGNNNFYEVMKSGETGELRFIHHDDFDEKDGSEGSTIGEFFNELEPHHVKDVLEQLNELTK